MSDVKRYVPALTLAVLLAFQAASFEHLLGFDELFSEDPIVTDDYSLHYGHALTNKNFLRRGRCGGPKEAGQKQADAETHLTSGDCWRSRPSAPPIEPPSS